MRAGHIIRVLAVIVLAFYVLMPSAAFGFHTDSECKCLKNGNRCGENGLLCHCCEDRGADTIGGAFIAKCRMVSSESVISQPPAVFGPINTAMTEHGQLSDIKYIEGLFDEISIAPPLRPPETHQLN